MSGKIITKVGRVCDADWYVEILLFLYVWLQCSIFRKKLHVVCGLPVYIVEAITRPKSLFGTYFLDGCILH